MAVALQCLLFEETRIRQSVAGGACVERLCLKVGAQRDLKLGRSRIPTCSFCFRNSPDSTAWLRVDSRPFSSILSGKAAVPEFQ